MHEPIEVQKPKSKPFKILSGIELVKEAPQMIPSLVEGLLLEVGVSMLVAKPKTGKSSLARQLAVAVSEGLDFLGKPTLQGHVLYVNAEGPVGVLAQHFKKLGLTQDTLHVVHEQMPYKGDEGLAKLEEAIQSLPKLRLVIVDPASKLLRLLDSFDPGEVLLGIEKLEALADKYKLHLMFLVHAKKKETDDPGDAAMGSTSFRGGTDTNIFLRKQGSQRTISTEQRWGVAMEQTVLLQDPESLAIQLGSSVEDLEDACNVAKERKTDERTRKVISDSFCITPHPTQGELLAAVTGKNTTKLRIIKQMVENGEIVAEADGRAIRYRWVGIPVETLSGVAA